MRQNFSTYEPNYSLSLERVPRPMPEGDNDNAVIDDLIEQRLFEEEEPETDIQDY